MIGDGNIYQFGIRSGDRSEWVWGKDHVNTHPFDFDGLETLVEQLGDKPVYFTVDLDVLDPSVFPGTGTPEPGGVTFDALRKAVTLVCNRCHIVGCDVNELSPHYDPTGASNAVAAKVVRRCSWPWTIIFNRIFRGRCPVPLRFFEKNRVKLLM